MLFEIDPVPLAENLTALGGAPLVVRAFRSLDLPGAIREHVHVKQRERHVCARRRAALLRLHPVAVPASAASGEREHDRG